jgi:putative ABC transport system permease protein
MRQALKGLARRPAFAMVAIVTLALGLGANAAIFSVIDAALLRPLPYPEADRLVTPWEHSDEIQQRLDLDRLPSSPGNVGDFRARNTTLAALASMRADRANLTGAGNPERVGAVRVSVEFFDLLGVPPIVGRTFVPSDATAGTVVVIGEGLWRRRFGGAPDVPGRTLSINGEPAMVLGVMPAWFRFPSGGELPEAFGFSSRPELWTLDVLTPEQQRTRGGKSFALVARLKVGITRTQAEADLNTIAAQISQEFPDFNAGWTVHVLPLREQLVGGVRPALLVLLAAVGFVLLIACTNVANLLLVRAAARQREFCIRQALGANRRRLIGELLAESVALSLVSSVLGILLAWWGL